MRGITVSPIKIAAAVLVACCSSTEFCAAQDAAQRRHEKFIQSLKDTATTITSQTLADIQSLEDWQQERPRRRREFLYTMGLDPLPDKTPLQAQLTGTVSRPGYRIEKIVFQSKPGLYVTANFYIPDASDTSQGEPVRRWPTILYVCGHSPHPVGAKWDYQDRAVWFVEHGYACFVVDTLEFGEVAGIHHGLHDLNTWHWLSRGYTPVGVEVWNAIRAVDYLETRAEVDASRIGITGISGGGAVSWYAAAADERIAVSVPVCGTFTFGSQATNWRADGQCDCIYYYNTFMTDLSMVGALIAPRPLLFCSGQLDLDFPPDGYHVVYQKVKRIYDLYAAAEGQSDRIKEVDEGVGHTDSPLFRREARQWMNRWLQHDDSPIEINVVEKKPSSPEELACLARLPRDAVNYRIDESFIPRATAERYETLSHWTRRRLQLISELSDRTFRWFPLAEIPFKTQVSGNRGGWADRYADYKDVEIETEPGVPIRIQLLRARERSSATPLVVYAKRRGDSIYFLDLDELLPLLGRCDVAILNARLTEHPVDAAAFADIERTAAWSGRTIASMQVWDILRTVKWLLEEEKLAPESTSIYGKGDMAIVSLYAALFDERISHVIMRDAPTTHGQGPALLNVLRITDIPEAAAALAPRQLVFIDQASPQAFDWTRAIYTLHGKPDHIRSAGSLPEAMEVWKY
jgi:dienelactone hydrolase